MLSLLESQVPAWVFIFFRLVALGSVNAEQMILPQTVLMLYLIKWIGLQ